jgi:hypothetical protein
MKLNNKWLRDEQFIEGLNTDVSKLYLQDLCSYLNSFLNTAPLKVVTTWDREDRGIIFFMGNYRKMFELDVNISKYEFITLIKNWLIRFYPQYEVELKRERELTSSEIAKIRKDCLDNGKPFDLNNYLNERVEYTETEKGIITKVFLLQDQFILQVNKTKYLCAPGSTKIPIRMSEFMNTLRKMKLTHKSNQDIYDYIKLNSFIINEIKEDKVNIKYKDKTMLNFFKINFQYIFENGLNKKNNFLYESGKFIIDFCGDRYLKESCLETYQKRVELIS